VTNGVSVTWLSEQTGAALSTILKHYGLFIHSSQADDLEMSKIEVAKPPKKVQFGHRFGHPKGIRKKFKKIKGKLASPTGFEPVLPT
jgi:hypothetical protein